jgi:ribonuclease Y
MEDMVRKFKGIDDAYVIQSGREVRAMVSPQGVSDDEMTDLSNEIATTLRKELTFPGQIKVTVVRESKFTDYAK